MLFSSLPLGAFHIKYLTHPVNFPCGRNWTGEPGENPRLSGECWRTLPKCDQRFDTGLEPMTSVVGGRRLDLSPS